MIVLIVAGYGLLLVVVVAICRAARIDDESLRGRESASFRRAADQAMRVPNQDADRWGALDELQARRVMREGK